MKNLRFGSGIAVIDDGVNEEYSRTGRLKYNVEITPNLEIRKRANHDPSVLSHGTTCAAIIHKYFRRAVLSSIKILNSKTREGPRDGLIKALLWCVKKRMKLVHLSLGSIDFRDFDEIKKAVRLVLENGVIIVAACNNRNVFTCPASLPGVIGVKCDISGILGEGEWVWNSFAPDGIEMTACSRHFLEYEPGRGNWTDISNSYAAPMITAGVCNLLEKNPAMPLKEIRDNLKNSACVKETRVFSIINKESDFSKMDIPLIVVYDEGLPKISGIAEDLACLFKGDGYNAVAADAFKQTGSLHISLDDYCRPGSFDLISGLKTFYSVYDPDLILLLCNSPVQIQKIEEVYEIDIKIIASSVNKHITGELIKKNKKSKLIILAVDDREKDFPGSGTCKTTIGHQRTSSVQYIRYTGEESVAGLYKIIVDLYSTQPGSFRG